MSAVITSSFVDADTHVVLLEPIRDSALLEQAAERLSLLGPTSLRA